MELFDLRSDTLTRPSPGMRRAMAEAEVGDDVYGEDPTVRALEERVAALLGKERALFVPSGTMANQIALHLHTRPGDEVLVTERTHCASYESGAAAALNGVQFEIIGSAGMLEPADIERSVKRAYTQPNTSLLVIENTHNRAGGRITPLETMRAVAERARAHSLRLHLDGARLWNAAVATGHAVADYAAVCDTVSVCFSKGLGAPVGSALAGSSDAITRARRFRKMLGGGMRQSGVLAAAALYALAHNVERLQDDHAAARALAELLAEAHGATVDVAHVETNIVNIAFSGPCADDIVRQARLDGVLVGAVAANMVRAVTHLDIPLTHARSAAERLARAVERVTRSAA